jgi:hypothetical protein
MSNKIHTVKGFVVGVIVTTLTIGGIALAAEVIAAPSTHKVKVDGEDVEIKGYAIDGHNYFMLRDVASAIDFGVWYNEEESTVMVETDKSYDPEYTGTPTEPEPTEAPATGADNTEETTPTPYPGYPVYPGAYPTQAPVTTTPASTGSTGTVSSGESSPSIAPGGPVTTPPWWSSPIPPSPSGTTTTTGSSSIISGNSGGAAGGSPVVPPSGG